MTDASSLTDDIAGAFQDLDLSESKKNLKVQLDELLKSLFDSGDKTKFCEKVVDDNLLSSFTKILQNGTIKDRTKVAEVIAELAKVEECRLSCVFNGVIPLLVDLLDSDDLNANLQACRSLGNVCYEHDGGRMCVAGCGALKKLVALMHRILKFPKNQETHQLKLISTGFLLNILNSYEIVKKHPEHLDIVNVLGVYLNECIDEDDIMTHIMLSVSCIVDEDYEQCEIIANNFTPSLIRVLNKSSSIEVLESCLELLSAIADNECFKTKLVEHGTHEAAINVVRRFMNKCDKEIPQAIVKLAADLVVLILIGDESMTALYANGEGIVIKELLEWLASDVMSLNVAGALAIGNFARSDGNCIQMVEERISCLLLRVLQRYSANDSDIRTQHSLLAALRNLAIPRVNKPILIKQGCLDVLLPMVETTETYPVVFKLLGALRMLVDGQPETAARLSNSKEILGKLVAWANQTDSPATQAEASRILAWIVHSSEEKLPLVETYKITGALEPLINMLASEHQIMKLEASFSLKSLLYGIVDEELVEYLKNYKFIEKCVSLLKNPDHYVLCNIFQILQTFSQTDCGLSLLRTNDLVATLEKWYDNSYDSNICPDASLLTVIKG